MVGHNYDPLCCCSPCLLHRIANTQEELQSTRDGLTDELYDARKRITELELELAELREAVREMLPIWQEVVIDGGCDHSVGVCACDVIAMADTLAALLPERKNGAVDNNINK